MSNASTSPSTSSADDQPTKRRSWRRWLVGAAVIVALFFIMQDVIDPWGEEEYLRVPHGDHAHYVPQDRDPDVPLTEFPTYEPEPDERITPDGRVVPR